ncbi:unnamed protein product [Arabis nemorensis]|uniref:F-box associated beta-propeller type 3 domain-containing protein n=1 Tax=Arabis nemorensis TaxID=586526 RepID=A0A565BCE2_9BRAS|nr:unnamed protein product [Arabis nemorensis]
MLLSSAPRTPPSSLKFNQDLTIRKIGGFDLHVLCGFICFKVLNRARIYNPSTRQLVILPAIQSNLIARVGNYNIFFLCFDPVNDQYKLLCTITVMSNNMQAISAEL